MMGAASALAVTVDTNVQANTPQVQGQPTSNSTAVFPTNKQNEPTIALNPASPNFLIAGANDEQRQPACGPGLVRGATILSDCSFYPGIGTSGIYTSSDGGTSWANRGLLDDQASWQGKGVLSNGDPVIAYGPKPDAAGRFSWANGARAYYSSLAFVAGVKGTMSIIVSTSDDNGATWSAPVLATTKTSAVNFNDKNWITVDTSPSSPFFGRAYLSWTEFRSNTQNGNGSEPVMVAVSTNGGATFGAPNQLSPQETTAQATAAKARRSPPVRMGQSMWHSSRASPRCRRLPQRRQVVDPPNHDGIGHRHSRSHSRRQLPHRQFPHYLRGPTNYEHHRVRGVVESHRRRRTHRRCHIQRSGATWGPVVQVRLRRICILPRPRCGATGKAVVAYQVSMPRTHPRSARATPASKPTQLRNPTRVRGVLQCGSARLVRPGRQRSEQPAEAVLGRLQHARRHDAAAWFISTDSRTERDAPTLTPIRNTSKTTVWQRVATWPID